MVRVENEKQIAVERKKARTIIQTGSVGWNLASRKIPDSVARKILKNGILFHIPSCPSFLA
jgi:hypothetical protein